MIEIIIDKKIYGIYNLSMAKKTYISEILSWLDPNFHNYIQIIDKKNDSFTLSNKKLINRIKFNPKKKELELFCRTII